MDFVTILAILICATIFIISQASTSLKGQETVFYMPLYILTFNILLGIGISFAGSGGSDDDETTTTAFTAGKVRL